MNSRKKSIVVGAGIVGLATALALAKRDYQVEVYERHPKAKGASVRNFGMIWPVGQPTGPLYERAMLSRSIWLEVAEAAGIWFHPSGALHLAYDELEKQIIEEYIEANRNRRKCSFLSPQQARGKSNAIVYDGLKGALFTEEELVVDPREAPTKIPEYLHAKHGVTFHWNKAISKIEDGVALSGNQKICADEYFVCTGSNFEILYPQLYKKTNITKCKLQMMRLVSQPHGFKIGPALCSGLSMVHYGGFSMAPSLPKLKAKYKKRFGELLDKGIHVMVSQNGSGELTIGDSHEYGLKLDPFDDISINHKVINFLKRFLKCEDWTIQSTWHGIYSKMTDGSTELIAKPAEDVTIINGLGGAGMTLSFGLAEEIIDQRG